MKKGLIVAGLIVLAIGAIMSISAVTNMGTVDEMIHRGTVSDMSNAAGITRTFQWPDDSFGQNQKIQAQVFEYISFGIAGVGGVLLLVGALLPKRDEYAAAATMAANAASVASGSNNGGADNFCTSCGTQKQPGASFCQTCGNRI